MVGMITPGCWVQTPKGRAVCITVEPHDHSVVQRDNYPRPGYITCACEDDTCKDAVYVSFRYKAFRYLHDADGKVNGYEPDPIWVWDGELSNKVTFLRGPTRLSRQVLKLVGPYGRGEIPDTNPCRTSPWE